MSDDLDELDVALRRAMAALDGETPPGYFEALPAQTLARLDDPAIGELPDDPGLQDLRDPASEPRVRPLRVAHGRRPADGDDDDDAVFSSQIMAAVELPEPDEPPEPAKRVASVAGPRRGVRSASSVIAVLPVPSGEPAMEDTGARPASAAPMPSSPASAGPVEAPASAAASMPSAELPGRRRSRRVRAAVVGGIGLAAAVVGIYLVNVRSARPILSSGERAAPASEPTAASPSAGGGPSMSSVAAGSAANAAPGDPGGSSVSAYPGAVASGTASGSAATAPAIATDAGSSVVPGSPSGGAPDAAPEPIGKFAGPGTKRPGNAKAPSKSGRKLQVEVPAGAGGSGAAAAGPGAAGADRPGQDAQQLPDKPGPSGKKIKSSKPRPDRTSLSSDDIERAMAAVAGKARACAAGTSGTASLRLTVAPSGRIAQVTVTGPFAGTPVGACVERAVRDAAFPPWDGAPQSVDYSYLLSD